MSEATQRRGYRVAPHGEISKKGQVKNDGLSVNVKPQPIRPHAHQPFTPPAQPHPRVHHANSAHCVRTRKFRALGKNGDVIAPPFLPNAASSGLSVGDAIVRAW